MLFRSANVACIAWTLFVCVIFSLPNDLPVTPTNMNYSSVITVGVIVLSLVWYIAGGRLHYHGPQSNVEHAPDGGERRDGDQSEEELKGKA